MAAFVYDKQDQSQASTVVHTASECQSYYHIWKLIMGIARLERPKFLYHPLIAQQTVRTGLDQVQEFHKSLQWTRPMVRFSVRNITRGRGNKWGDCEVEFHAETEQCAH